jgi:hypothetical protein
MIHGLEFDFCGYTFIVISVSRKIVLCRRHYIVSVRGAYTPVTLTELKDFY